MLGFVLAAIALLLAGLLVAAVLIVREIRRSDPNDFRF